MGGGLALHALRNDLSPKYKGLFAISSFLVESSAVFTQALGNATRLPLMIMHGKKHSLENISLSYINYLATTTTKYIGDADGFIKTSWGRQTATNLLLKNIDVQFRTYENIAHELDEAEVFRNCFYLLYSS